MSVKEEQSFWQKNYFFGLFFLLLMKRSEKKGKGNKTN
jgi:hypothetical protein